ncbi:hypothetical protein tinsulaeT_20010 [Thalassotalea insulae]|uniref:Uncharacterized protein n=1 Tax=Thalassotalea insulae TaxID=2056778 RepID=A0ABQ6GVI9_9GAMM|nr:hypothetical protein [Thalassotalea insulae]GLX78661.1 hypothetical protein tinsulaeT_20010 [Thalassotalea insulae]
MTNQYRYKMSFTQPDSGMNKCSTVIGGVGILLGMASLAFFGKGSIHGYTLIYIVVLVALNFLSYHAQILRMVTAVISGSVSLALIAYSFPDFISNNMIRSQKGFYYVLVGLYSAGVCLCQMKAIRK